MDPGVVVSHDQPSINSTVSKCFSFGHVPLRELESADPQNYQALVELFSKLANNFIGKLLAKNWTKSGVYVQNVITFGDDRERSLLHKYLLEQGAAFHRDLFGFSFDDDHVHVLHSCAFSSSQCKCRWRKEIPCGKIRPGYKFRSNLREWRRHNFINAVIYFFYKKGGNKEAWIEGRRQRLEDHLERVQWSQVEEELGRILGISNSQTGLDLRSCDSDGEFTEPAPKRRKRDVGFEEGSQKNKGRQTKWQIISGKIQQLLERTAICPLEGIKSEKCFLDDDWLTDPDNRVRVNEAITVWSHKINAWTLRDFLKMYQATDMENLVFSRSKSYYSLEESFTHIDNLLRFQFDDDEALIKGFLQNLANVLDWQPEQNPLSNAKTNTFLIYSPPSAGKNFFFDTLFTALLNLGQLGTANKNNNFAFQDAPNRRVILWNEPNYEASVTDYLKTLFEGGDTKVRVKMLGDTHVKRTPIIILTNNVVNFMSDKAFADRIKQYKWKAAPQLKDLKLKPYPLVFFDILLKYEIKF